MLRFPLIAAIAALSVMPATATLAKDDPKTIHIHNNTSYDFTGGYVHNKNNVSVQSLPTTINSGDSHALQMTKKGGKDWKINVQWEIGGQLGQSVAIKYSSDSPGEAECHTQIPSGLHSDHYNCNSSNPKVYFCDASDQSACDK